MLTPEESNELHDAIMIAKEQCKDRNALAYISAFDESGVLYGAHGMHIQLLYILNNMRS